MHRRTHGATGAPPPPATQGLPARASRAALHAVQPRLQRLGCRRLCRRALVAAAAALLAAVAAAVCLLLRRCRLLGCVCVDCLVHSSGHTLGAQLLPVSWAHARPLLKRLKHLWRRRRGGRWAGGWVGATASAGGGHAFGAKLLPVNGAHACPLFQCITNKALPCPAMFPAATLHPQSPARPSACTAGLRSPSIAGKTTPPPPGAAGSGRPDGQGRAWQGRAWHGMAGQGRAGQGFISSVGGGGGAAR